MSGNGHSNLQSSEVLDSIIMIDVVLTAFMQAAFVGVVACLISESVIATPIRKFLDETCITIQSCPICMGFWLAAPFLWYGFLHYFLVVGFSNLWMLLILHTYLALEHE